MKKLTFAIPLVALALLTWSITTTAENLPQRGPIPFDVYDKNGDGLISETEFMEIRAERISQKASDKRSMRGATGAPSFSAFDSDNNGSLTKQELEAGQKKQQEKRKNKKQNKSLNKSLNKGQKQGKMMSNKMPSFSTFDLNSDGKIVEQEFNELRSQKISEKAAQGKQMKNIADAPSFADIDKNSDGEIDKTEFKDHQKAHRQLKKQR
ncbi:EF-hand domain-containing protein [Thalassotalea sp. PLHSN55]|uniref:EF-hand domain-containing protein n=1 Tax=Thalassotalea sp. PLHSN55 TaxID=3435888 RepID=UPI003F846CB7